MGRIFFTQKWSLDPNYQFFYNLTIKATNPNGLFSSFTSYEVYINITSTLFIKPQNFDCMLDNQIVELNDLDKISLRPKLFLNVSVLPPV